jgi:hypothetical protein
MTAEELQQLAASGFSVEDHTVKDDVTLWGASATTLDTIANGSKETLEALTQRPVQFIAYTGLWSWPSAAAGGAAEGGLFQAAELVRLRRRPCSMSGSIARPTPPR